MIRALPLFAALTILMTWPQAIHMASHGAEHQDVFFNMWRLSWIAHALSTSPSRLFDGNIFYPESGALTLSDAMLVEGLAGAPLIWMGLPNMLVHNLLLLGAITASGAGMFVLARHLTGSRAAGVIAGIIFAYAPYRFEHYMHMELQWTVWMPWAFWALQRTCETGRWRFGALAGLFVGLQMASSIYYGLFLAMLQGLASLLSLITVPRERLIRTIASLALGGVVAGVLVGTYAIPYLRTRERVGVRSIEETRMFSAKPRNYLVAPEGNFLYGGRRGQGERRLLPGLLAVVLALTGLLLRPPAKVQIVYVIALVLAFEMSLGMYGYTYRFLYERAPPFQSLRAPARLGIFVVFFLAALAAYGYAALEAAARPVVRRVMPVAFAGVLILEYWTVPLTLTRYDNDPPPLYAWLAQQPRGIVAEFPMPAPNGLPHEEPRYAYMSTFHWMPTVNGYSGYVPPGYLRGLEAMKHFPSDASVMRLRREGVRYVIVHDYPADRDAYARTLYTLTSHGLSHLGSFSDGRVAASVFALR